MRLLKAEVKNFGSYRDLVFQIDKQGLILIHGNTGSGKSTIQDIIPWVLFGITAKGSKADEIKSWGAGEATVGKLTLEEDVKIVRIRGKAGQNDLYWEILGHIYRGKDITESQALLEAYLGVSKDLYIAGAYYNEFSPIGSFFTSKASSRRELLEKLSDLSLPKTLYERANNERKGVNKAKLSVSERLNQAIGRLEGLEAAEAENQRNADGWAKSQARNLQSLKEKSENFDKEIQSRLKQLNADSENWIATANLRTFELKSRVTNLSNQIGSLSEKCPTCGKDTGKLSLVESKKHTQDELRKLKAAINPYTAQIEQTKSSENTYAYEYERQSKKTNPFASNQHGIERQKNNISVIRKEQDVLDNKISALEQLTEIAYITRGLLLKSAVKGVENKTNQYLETYFDSEIRVGFDIENNDNLEVSIRKDGYECSYSQLSKGQRGLLKLCFSVAVMKAAANKAGIHFNALFFDEALDGLDANLKTKAFGLFSELEKEHESVFVIEHEQQLKSLFSKSLHVKLENDESKIYD